MKNTSSRPARLLDAETVANVGLFYVGFRLSRYGWNVSPATRHARGSDLVATLAAFLDTGGRYDATAAELSIGRSTLRYRLARIKEITGADLGDPDVRFQLHLAAKAWFTRQALGGAGR